MQFNLILIGSLDGKFLKLVRQNRHIERCWMTILRAKERPDMANEGNRRVSLSNSLFVDRISGLRSPTLDLFRLSSVLGYLFGSVPLTGGVGVFHITNIHHPTPSSYAIYYIYHHFSTSYIVTSRTYGVILCCNTITKTLLSSFWLIDRPRIQLSILKT